MAEIKLQTYHNSFTRSELKAFSKFIAAKYSNYHQLSSLMESEIQIRTIFKRSEQISSFFFLHQHLHDHVSACVKVSPSVQKVIQNQIAETTYS